MTTGKRMSWVSPYAAPPRGRKARECKTCGVGPGQSCVRWREQDGIRWAIRLKSAHQDR